MSLRSRLSIAVAAGALAVTALATPAVAGDDPDDPRDDWGQNQTQNQTQNHSQDQNQDHNPRLSRGVVTASSLALRSAPNRGGQIIRWADRGEVVSIFCKTNGQSVQGNRQWYLLTDGTWAWGSARYIRTVGPAPRWC
ncbi:SH3 domain-containing protein [Streptomyces sp. NBC_00882]|uniref:SH3 domain-containing protein n=1 Tax=Streptomyces TaxID=1883 RepID=UPI0038633500|nr:SH3 domain-containing protein [Streptomyces sp. NBC_00882]WSZ60699.1 SH3 domain-containing protein [Streptomyces canus]